MIRAGHLVRSSCRERPPRGPVWVGNIDPDICSPMGASDRRQVPSRREAFGLASQAEMYLARALEEFHRSANAPDLWVPVDAFHRGSLLEGAQAALTARNRRLHFLRSTILFAALAAEAFANELLDELLSSADADALERLPTPEKLLIGARVAAETSPLARGADPMQGLVELFKTRNVWSTPARRADCRHGCRMYSPLTSTPLDRPRHAARFSASLAPWSSVRSYASIRFAMAGLPRRSQGTGAFSNAIRRLRDLASWMSLPKTRPESRRCGNKCRN